MFAEQEIVHTVSQIELLSPFSPDECFVRLREIADCGILNSAFGSKPLAGSVYGTSVRLRKRIRYNNSFQTYLVGSLESQDGGTLFRGRTGMHPFVLAFMVIWLGAAILIGGEIFVIAVGQLIAGQGPLKISGLIIPPLILAVCIGLFYFCRWLASDEEEFLIKSVAQAINARQRPPD